MAVESAVDLDRGQRCAGIGKLVIMRQALGIKSTAPGCIGPAANADTGVVGLTISEVSGQTMLTVYGCGQNTDTFLSDANQLAGPTIAFEGIAANLQVLINPSGVFTVVNH